MATKATKAAKPAAVNMKPSNTRKRLSPAAKDLCAEMGGRLRGCVAMRRIDAAYDWEITIRVGAGNQAEIEEVAALLISHGAPHPGPVDTDPDTVVRYATAMNVSIPKAARYLLAERDLLEEHRYYAQRLEAGKLSASKRAEYEARIAALKLEMAPDAGMADRLHNMKQRLSQQDKNKVHKLAATAKAIAQGKARRARPVTGWIKPMTPAEN